MLLYSQVLEKLQDSDDVLTSGDCSKISMMSGEEAENIFLLILHHCCSTNSEAKIVEEIIEVLYKYRPATKTGLGAKFNLIHIPENLQRILSCYLRLISSK